MIVSPPLLPSSLRTNGLPPLASRSILPFGGSIHFTASQQSSTSDSFSPRQSESSGSISSTPDSLPPSSQGEHHTHPTHTNQSRSTSALSGSRTQAQPDHQEPVPSALEDEPSIAMQTSSAEFTPSIPASVTSTASQNTLSSHDSFLAAATEPDSDSLRTPEHQGIPNPLDHPPPAPNRLVHRTNAFTEHLFARTEQPLRRVIPRVLPGQLLQQRRTPWLEISPLQAQMMRNHFRQAIFEAMSPRERIFFHLIRQQQAEQARQQQAEETNLAPHTPERSEEIPDLKRKRRH